VSGTGGAGPIVEHASISRAAREGQRRRTAVTVAMAGRAAVAQGRVEQEFGAFGH
jgi:hypothetical protein